MSFRPLSRWLVVLTCYTSDYASQHYVSVPYQREWGCLTRYMSKLQFNRKRFPSPLEVIGGYYQRVILRMRKTTLCFRTLPRWMEVLTESRLLKGWKKFRFPSPREANGGSYLRKEELWRQPRVSFRPLAGWMGGSNSIYYSNNDWKWL